MHFVGSMDDSMTRQHEDCVVKQSNANSLCEPLLEHLRRSIEGLISWTCHIRSRNFKIKSANDAMYCGYASFSMPSIAVTRKGRMSSKSIPEELLWLRPRADWRSFLCSSCTVPISSSHLQIRAGGGIGHGSRDFKPDNEFGSEV